MELKGKKTISEVYDILSHLDKADRENFNKNAIKFLKENRDKNFVSTIDYSVPLSEQPISKNTLALLTIYYIIGFCKTKEKKQEVIDLLKQNMKNR